MGLTKPTKTPRFFNSTALNFEDVLRSNLLKQSLLKVLDLKNYFSTLCDAKNNIKKTSKKVKRTLFNLFNFRPGGF